MKESKVLEAGTHEELLAKDGGYASMYKVQAEAFVDTKTVSEPRELTPPFEMPEELV